MCPLCVHYIKYLHDVNIFERQDISFYTSKALTFYYNMVICFYVYAGSPKERYNVETLLLLFQYHILECQSDARDNAIFPFRIHFLHLTPTRQEVCGQSFFLFLLFFLHSQELVLLESRGTLYSQVFTPFLDGVTRYSLLFCYL